MLVSGQKKIILQAGVCFMKESRKTRYTRMALEDSLIELMTKKPISKITIKELCENADINRTTFYSHYSDQYDLLRQIEDDALSWAKEAISGVQDIKSMQEIKNIIEKILEYFADDHKHIQVLMSEQGNIDFQKQLITLIYDYCGIIPFASENTDAQELYFVFIVNGSVGLIQNWLKNGLRVPAKEIAEIIYHMALSMPVNPIQK